LPKSNKKSKKKNCHRLKEKASVEKDRKREKRLVEKKKTKSGMKKG